MTPEIQQYLIWAGMLVGGIVLRHFGVTLPGLPVSQGQPSARTPGLPVAVPDQPPTPNGRDVGGPSRPLLDAIDSRIALLEQRLLASPSSSNDNLSSALASLAHRLMDRHQPPATPPSPPDA